MKLTLTMSNKSTLQPVDEYEYDEELLDEEEYERMDQNEINDLVADEAEQSDPTIENNNEI